MTANRLLSKPGGWLVGLSSGRIAPIQLPALFFAPLGPLPRLPRFPSGTARPGSAAVKDCDISFIFATGEHEMVGLPDTSPWAGKYEAGPRVGLPDVIDEGPGLIYDTLGEGRSNSAWGLLSRPSVTQVHVYPNARGGRLIADVDCLDNGHTEGLEPQITEELIEMIVAAPGGSVQTNRVRCC